jgi:hypothetical protein
MAGTLTFKVDVYEVGKPFLGEYAKRAKDLSIVYNDIIKDWVDNNSDKFDASAGYESSGVLIDPGVFWESLTEPYIKQKRRLGQPDQIMVATGELEDAMTDPDQIFQYVRPDVAMFGTPLNPEDYDKVKWNWNTRQVVFLSLGDQDMIRKKVHDYLAFGPGYESIQFEKGMQNLKKAQMDVDFQNTVGDFGL